MTNSRCTTTFKDRKLPFSLLYITFLLISILLFCLLETKRQFLVNTVDTKWHTTGWELFLEGNKRLISYRPLSDLLTRCFSSNFLPSLYQSFIVFLSAFSDFGCKGVIGLFCSFPSTFYRHNIGIILNRKSM